MADLAQKHEWGSMHTDVRRVMKACLQCWQRASGGPRSFGMQALPRGWPGNVVAMDFFGPLAKTTRGATILLVLLDHFTRLGDIIALGKAEAADAVSCLRERWAPQGGVSAAVLSDNGPQFVAGVLPDFCACTSLRELYSTRYYPKGLNCRKLL